MEKEHSRNTLRKMVRREDSRITWVGEEEGRIKCVSTEGWWLGVGSLPGFSRLGHRQGPGLGAERALRIFLNWLLGFPGGKRGRSVESERF